MDNTQKASIGEKLVGEKVLIRTVTYFLLGEVVGSVAGFVELNRASWVADTGRLGKAVATGDLNEVEILGDGVHVNLGAAVDVIPWHHELPTTTK